MLKQKKMTCVIDNLDENKAVLKFDDGQKLTVSIDCLPDETEEGGVMSVFFGRSIEETQDREAKAKNILNQILKKK